MAPPIYVKGGQWTNVEDQILRAAVSKYGLTQWARVASLLPKKTAKQAKARWNEYLNPIINKDEWSLEEDEKLLGLAKLLPNQWRSIAPIMGRTPTQCVERYQQLLDRAMGNMDDDEETEDLKLSGPGIETLPALGNAYESLPSRPDMEDMDEDEQEMLSEAKARLANTVGKKAKRKERERMVQENRRLTLLEKRRDLKAAGVRMSLELKNKNKRNDFDYNADIPHEHAPPPGLYDTTDESLVNDREKLSFQERVKFKGVDTPQETTKKKAVSNEEKIKKRQRQELADAAKLFSDAADQDIKRRKLDIPAPGTTEHDVQRAHDRISEASQDLLRANEKIAPRKIPLEAKPDKKSSIKKFRDFIKTMFSKLPPPKNNVELKLPKLDIDVQALAGDLGDDDELEVLEPDVGSERTLASIRGLAVPDPRFLKSLSPSLSELDRAIAVEFQNLIKADYKQSVDASFAADEIRPVDPIRKREVLAAINKELESGVPQELPPRNFSLPRAKEAIDEAFAILDELHESSNKSDSQIDQNSAEYNEAARVKYDAIVDAAQKLADETNNGAVLTKVMDLEEEAMEGRAANLHSLVEKVEMASSDVKLQ